MMSKLAYLNLPFNSVPIHKVSRSGLSNVPPRFNDFHEPRFNVAVGWRINTLKRSFRKSLFFLGLAGVSGAGCLTPH
jgi:hypothetical protein